MRRTAVLLTVALTWGTIALPAQAHPGHPGPRITRFEFVDPPLKSGSSERLVIIAHDPNSWISEIQVFWEDEDMTGGVIFADTFCVQDPSFQQPGTRAKLKLDVTFDHPGSYHVEARAISEKRCEGGNDTRFSKTAEQDVTVEDPRQTFTDPDDTEGPLDVLAAEQTIAFDEESLENHVVHTLTMAGDLGPTPLGGSDDYVELSFDTDDDASTFERTVLVDKGTDGVLHALITDADGAMVGEALVATEGATMSIEFDKRLLGSWIDRYGWFATTHDPSSPTCSTATPCTDRAPDAGIYLHTL